MACRMSPDEIMTLEKKHDWNYIDTYVGHLEGDYGTITSFYRDAVDTAAGTPYRIKMDICHDTCMVAISMKTLEDQMINLRKQQEEETLLGDMEVTDQHGNKEKGEHSKDVPRIDPNNTDIIFTIKHDEVISGDGETNSDKTNDEKIAESDSKSEENSNPTPPATTENDIQTSKETICPHFLTGHCSQKRNCLYNHDVSTCKLGRNCPNKSTTCLLRHPKVCTNFINKKCGFTNSKGVWVNYRNCSYIHQVPEPHIHLPPNLDHTNHHEVSKAPNNYQETLQNDLSTALLKIEALEKSVQQLKENIKGIEAENLDHKKQLQDQQYLIDCLSSNPTNKKSNNETPSLKTAEPGVQIMNKDIINTVDSEVSGSTKGNPVASGGMEEAERWDGNEEKEPEKGNAFNNQVPSSANSKAGSSSDTAEEERLWVTEEQPQRVTCSLNSHDNHSVLDKVKKVFYIGSPPTVAVPKKKKSKDKTSREVAQPVAKCDNCRTNSRSTTPPPPYPLPPSPQP